MLSKSLEKALNEQVSVEAHASFAYLAMGSWCEQQGMTGAAKFFFAQSAEERGHMLKIFHYINSVKGHALAPAVKQPTLKFKGIVEMVKEALGNEEKVTASVYKLSELAQNEKDYGTYNFMQFYVDEQREEEVLFNHILERIELIGTEGMGKYYIDKELEALAGGSAPVTENGGK